MTNHAPPSTAALHELESVRVCLVRDSHQAGNQRDYGRARKLMDLAERIDGLRAEIKSVYTDESQTAQRDGTSPAGGGRQPTAKRPDQGDYPRFRRRGDSVVKQALQRNGRDIYEHAVPRDQFQQILDRLTAMAAGQAAGRQREFTMNDIEKALPPLPRYMVYVTVSLLLRVELLARARKGAYVFANAEAFAADSARLWEQLQNA
jgi:hypothetical protein